MERGVLLWLEFGDAARRASRRRRCVADAINYRRHAASLMMLRKGYITRYLCERLAFGLAPESVKAFFVQRQRWARGAMQILYLAAGPLGSGLSLMQRLLFLPTHWLSQGLMLLLTIIAPLVFLWTGTLPLVNVTPDAVVYY